MIPLAKPLLSEDEVNAAREVILSGWVTQGPKVLQFEEDFARYTGARYACAVSSCTTALHMALVACGIGAGDEVLTVSHSFIATANSIHYTGALPVFVDIDIATFNMAPELVEQAITDKTKAIVCVHQIGMPCDLSAILKIAKKHDLKVIEDAACAAGSEIFLDDAWDKIGNAHSDAVCFSFHPRKILTTGDGGMVTTNDAELDKNFRLLRQHGMSMSDTARHKAQEVAFEEYPVIGYNFRMTDIQAAIGVVQLKRLPGFVTERRALVDQYTDLLKGSDFILPHVPEWARPNWQSYCVRTPEMGMQKRIMQRLLDQGIATRRGIMNAHQEKAYADASTCRVPSEGLKKSELARDTGIILPLYSGLSQDDVTTVATALKKALAEG